jgi:hypothetical protein
MFTASVLQYYDLELSIMIKTDISNRVVAGVLSQQDPQTDH